MNIKNKKVFIVIGILLVISISSIIIYRLNSLSNNDNINDDIAFVEETKETTSTTSMEEFYVEVKGCVSNPGVYHANSNMIVDEIIKAAGGFKSNAYTDDINLSENVSKGMVIYVSNKNDITTTKIRATRYTNSSYSNKSNNNGSSNTSNKIININTASKSELMSLNGIGETKANAIIEYRNSNPFTSIEDIKKVKGIGEANFAKIKDYITVN